MDADRLTGHQTPYTYTHIHPHPVRPNISPTHSRIKHPRHAIQPWRCPPHNSRRRLNTHILLLKRRFPLRLRALHLPLLVDTHAPHARQQVQDDGPLLAIVAPADRPQLGEFPLDASGVAHAGEAEDDTARDVVVEVDDACDEGGEVFLAVYEVRFVEGNDCVLEDFVAEIIADGGRSLEAREEHAEDAHGGINGAGIADANARVAEEEDWFEDGGVGEDEVADGGPFFAGFVVEAGEL